jgi:hypothetical protein
MDVPVQERNKDTCAIRANRILPTNFLIKKAIFSDSLFINLAKREKLFNQRI